MGSRLSVLFWIQCQVESPKTNFKCLVLQIEQGYDSPVTMQDLLKEYSISKEIRVSPTGAGHSTFGGRSNAAQGDTFVTTVESSNQKEGKIKPPLAKKPAFLN